MIDILIKKNVYVFNTYVYLLFSNIQKKKQNNPLLIKSFLMPSTIPKEF